MDQRSIYPDNIRFVRAQTFAGFRAPPSEKRILYDFDLFQNPLLSIVFDEAICQAMFQVNPKLPDTAWNNPCPILTVIDYNDCSRLHIRGE